MGKRLAMDLGKVMEETGMWKEMGGESGRKDEKSG